MSELDRGNAVPTSDDVPEGTTPPDSGGTVSPTRIPWIVLAGVVAVIAVGAGLAVLIPESPPPVAATSPSASAVTSASPATADPTPTAAPSRPAAAPTSEPTPTLTLGPITRWATAASFGSEGAAEEVRDIAYGGGHFVAVGFREPLVARGQVGPSQHDPLLWISPDGASWEALQLGPEFDGAHLFAAATLPDGAAAIYGYVDRDPDPNMEDIEAAAWRSTDGTTWTRFELVLPARPDAETPSYRYIGAIASGAGGYLTVDGYATEEGLVDLLLYSSDGARWEVAAHLGPDGSGWTDGLRDYAAGDEGFVLVGERYEIDAEQRVYIPIVRASSDGRTWIDADPDAMPEGPNLLVASVEGDWIATQTDFDAGTDITWFSNDGVAWEERAALKCRIPDPAHGLDRATSPSSARSSRPEIVPSSAAPR